MEHHRTRPDVPLGATALGLLAGTVAAAAEQTEWATLLLWLAAAALACARTRATALAVVAGLLLGARPLPVALPGVYEVEATVRHAGRPHHRHVMVTAVLERVAGQHAHQLARIHTPVWVARDWLPGTRVRAIVRLRGQDARGRWHGELPHAQAVLALEPPPARTGALDELRRMAAGAFDVALRSDNAALARAMVLGDRTHITREDRERFRDTGQAHLLAVSGLHVGLWLVGLLVLLRFLGLGPRLQAAVTLVMVALYVPLTGAPPSATRAGCAVGVHCGGRMLGRTPAPLVVLSIVALAVAIAQPRAAFEVAFRLSFGAVLGILLLTRPITAVLVRPRAVIPGLVAPPRAPLRRSLAVSLAAWMGTLPFVAASIGKAAPAASLVAVLTVPITAVVLMASMSVLLFGWIPGIGSLCGHAAQGSFDTLRMALQGAQTLGVRALPLASPTVLALVVYGLSCASLVRARSRRSALRALAACLGLIAVWWIGTPATSRAVHGYDPRPVTATLPLLVTFQDPSGLLILAAALAVVAFLSVRMHWLTPPGAACAAALGLLSGWVFGAAGLGALFAPFLVATVLGKLPGHERAGARTPRQVLSNGIPAAFGCALVALGQPAAGAAFFLGALACLGSDSCATEIGVRYGGAPWSLTGRAVKRGESGGMTLAGTAAALGGSLLAPLAWCAFFGWAGAWAFVLAVGAAGFAGSLLDSVLGATLQFRGRVRGTDTIVEQTHVDGKTTQRVRGVQLIDNDAVNLLSGLAAGAIAVALCNLGFAGSLP